MGRQINIEIKEDVHIVSGMTIDNINFPESKWVPMDTDLICFYFQFPDECRDIEYFLDDKGKKYHIDDLIGKIVLLNGHKYLVGGM